MAPKVATIKESTIRKMTRLATEHDAVNLSQGFPNEGPPRKVRMALAHGVLTGQAINDEWQSEADLEEALLKLFRKKDGDMDPVDQLNQYSPPMGRLDVRQAISDYYQRFYEYQVSPDDITVTLGATEAFASALRTLGRPNDKCVIFEPFHELYPSQCNIFYLDPLFVTLKRDDKGIWKYNKEELETAISQAKILMLNSPHNPTGKVFRRDELAEIVTLCQKYDCYIITDEIYEHMIFGENSPHYLLPKEFPEYSDRILVCNSLGKSASATGWRLGWCLHPPHVRETYRAIHDQMAVMSPHPVQYATLSYLKLPDEYFDQLSSRYQARVQNLAKALVQAGFTVTIPEGSYYLFVNFRSVPKLAEMTSMEAAIYLLKEVGVASVSCGAVGRMEKASNLTTE